ncbi:Transcription termination factor [Elusimicrobium minutum Pei191]|uniref:Transcription termination/antitermination protein NusA n=1 Tax=Elusimicrobium minutum (strain Pei191) TaxID=445932 RepID=B2KC94_ELUMP|nr:transcription termination/antitermination protein NusA [Elusimicrobium minutum]ACC98221.1 Transcription termination factor [Elusimicrobium minutum Pei191]
MEGNPKELMMALESLEREKNIKRDDIIKTIEDALVSALRKNLGKTAQISAKINPEEGDIKAFQVLNIVEIVANPEMEISLEQAKAMDDRSEVGGTITNVLEVEDFSRIAAQIAKQVLIQKVRGIERENTYKEFKPREGEVITGSVRRFSDRDIVVDLGKVEAILPYSEQIKRERYSNGSRIKAIITKVLSQQDLLTIGEDPVLGRYKSAAFKMDKGQRGPYVILSRTSPAFLEDLFKVEVPEIGEGIVEIKAIQRDPGFRAKVVVRSYDNKVDPIGTCVGMRGIRIRAIMNELSGERIDLIPYSEDVTTMIMNSIAPARANSVKIISAEEKKALIIVPDDQLAIAIGKDWQNIKLASKLTGWELEVKSESQKLQEGQATVDNLESLLASVEGIGPKTAETLVKAGFSSVEKIAALEPEHLATVQGIGEKSAAKIIEGAKKYLETQGEEVLQEEAVNDDNQEGN